MNTSFSRTAVVLAVIGVMWAPSAMDQSAPLTPPTVAGEYRFRDLASLAYSPTYRSSFTYNTANATVTWETRSDTFRGRLSASGLKPNFAYQLKLSGLPGDDDAANERLGYAGRWYRIQPDPGGQTNFLDQQYESRGPGEVWLGYLVFDFFFTDGEGKAEVSFAADSSLHVLWRSDQGRTRTAADTAPRPYSYSAGDPAYDPPEQGQAKSGSIYGENEGARQGADRGLPGTLQLPAGAYQCRFQLTEESFHEGGLSYGGYWALALEASVAFTIDRAAPSIISGPWAQTLPVVLPATATLHVLAGDPDTPAAGLTYTWEQTGGPGTVLFTPNGSNASADTQAAFSLPGLYQVRVSVSDGRNAIAGADLPIQVLAPPPGPCATMSVLEGLAVMGTKRTAKLQVRLDQAPPTALRIRYAVSGSAQPGKHYLRLPGQVSMEAGRTEAGIAVRAAKKPVGGSRNLTLTLLNGAGYSVATPDRATVLIHKPKPKHWWQGLLDWAAGRR